MMVPESGTGLAGQPHPLGEISKRVKLKNRKIVDVSFRWFCIVVALVSVLVLFVLLASIVIKGLPHLNMHFLTHYPEPEASKAGLGPAIWGTVWVCVCCGFFAIPIGVATAVFLEEFQPKNKWFRRFHSFIQLNIRNLAGVPSVVYGILGLTVFVSMGNLLGTTKEPSFEFGVTYYDQFFTGGERALIVPVENRDDPPSVVTPGMQAMTVDGEMVDVNVVASRRELRRLSDEEAEFALVEGRKAGRVSDPSWYHFRIPFGRGVMAGALTLMLVILPIVIISSQEALRSIPSSLREAGFGLGATRWQVVRNVTLPAAVPGIMTGSILSISRAIGEAAPVLMIAGILFITTPPASLMDDFTVMPLQIFNWAQRPGDDFREIASTASIVLLVILFVFNSVAVLTRQFTQKELS